MCQNNSIYVKNQLSRIIGGTQIITNKKKYTCFYKIIHFFMQFSAVEIRFIVTTYLYSTFANDLKRIFFFFFLKNVHSYRVCSFKALASILVEGCTFIRQIKL